MRMRAATLLIVAVCFFTAFTLIAGDDLSDLDASSNDHYDAAGAVMASQRIARQQQQQAEQHKQQQNNNKQTESTQQQQQEKKSIFERIKANIEAAVHHKFPAAPVTTPAVNVTHAHPHAHPQPVNPHEPIITHPIIPPSHKHKPHPKGYPGEKLPFPIPKEGYGCKACCYGCAWEGWGCTATCRICCPEGSAAVCQNAPLNCMCRNSTSTATHPEPIASPILQPHRQPHHNKHGLPHPHDETKPKIVVSISLTDIIIIVVVIGVVLICCGGVGFHRYRSSTVV